MRLLSVSEASSLTIESLGFDSAYVDLETPEILAALVRKAGSVLCPCSEEALARTIVRLIQPLVTTESLYEVVRDHIDQVVGYGDLVEATDEEGKTLVYLAQPSYIKTSETRFLFFGVIPDGEDPIPPGLRTHVTPVLYSRRAEVADSKQAEQALLEAGFIKLTTESWLRCPVASAASVFVQRYDDALSNAGPAGSPDDVFIVDYSLPVTYYKGRWTKLKKQTGRFIARRSQGYGAPLWCYIEATEGIVNRLIDFPLFEDRWRGCDEAWHLLQALDSPQHPQQLRIRPGRTTQEALLELYSPVPEWAVRRWEAIGSRTVSRGALMTFVIASSQVDAECNFAKERMWLERV